MDIINNAMMYFLNALHTLVGNYGLAIVLLTVGIRLLLWPVNTAQTKSMRKMQELQPKLKALQERHKDNPQKMQQELMKFYAENKFNPLAGCLPMLIQLPIFIGLYSVLNSPDFLIHSANERFLFVERLYHTLQSHAGEPMDGVFQVKDNDRFTTANNIELMLTDGTTSSPRIKDPRSALTYTPQPLIPGRPVTLTLNLKALGVADDPVQQKAYASMLSGAEVLVLNDNSKEIETVELKNVNGVLKGQLPTQAGETKFNMDVLVLITAYGLLTLLYQRVMTAKQRDASKTPDPQAEMQAKMMKMMPLMFVVMMFFIPIPAGVMIYLVVTTALMFLQTAWVNFSEDRRHAPGKPSDQIVEVKAD